MICVDLQIVSYWRIIQHVSRNKPPRAEMDKEKFSFKSRWFSGQTTVMWTEFPPQYVEAQTPPAGQTYSWCSARGRRFKPHTTPWQARALQAQLAVLVGIGVCQTWGIFPESSLLPPLVGQGARQWGEELRGVAWSSHVPVEGWVKFFYSKRCRSFTGKRRGSNLQSNHGEWWLIFKCKKKKKHNETIKCFHTARLR